MANKQTNTVEYRRATRKIKKHMVEKKRRLRMNSALDHMKTIVLEALGKDPSKYESMEKADILDITVSYLCQIQSTSPVSMTTAQLPPMTSSSSSSRAPSPSGFSDSFDSTPDVATDYWPRFDSRLTGHSPPAHVVFPETQRHHAAPIAHDIYRSVPQMALHPSLPVTSYGYDVRHQSVAYKMQHQVPSAGVWRPW